MGFGFLFIFLLVPVCCLLLILSLVFDSATPIKAIGVIWLGVFALIILGQILSIFVDKKVLSKRHYYGEYVIDRDFFKGKQADWQYNTFRFEVAKSDSVFFYVTDGREVLETYKGIVVPTRSASYHSARLNIKFDEPTHHVFTSNPTTYREVWDFYLVFHSVRFSNMYFRKGKWKAID